MLNMTSVSNNNITKDSVDGLPKQFISSLRILFDILDETRAGFVRLRDIESRWSDDGVRGLPPGVVDGLRKVTPPSGLLTFERFVAGLKLVLTKKRDDLEMRRPVNVLNSKENRTPLQEFNNAGDNNREVSSQQFLNDMRFAVRSHHNNGNRDYDNIHVRNQKESFFQQNNPSTKYYDDPKFQKYNNDMQYDAIESQRKSPPQASKSGSISHKDMPSYNAYTINPEVLYHSNPGVGGNHGGTGTFRRTVSNNQMPRTQDHKRPPAVPPRNERPPKINSYSPQMKKSLSGPDLVSHSHSPPAIPPRDQQKNRILNDLKNWQREWSTTQSTDYNKYDHMFQPFIRHKNQDNSIYANIEQFQGRSVELQQIKHQPQQSSPQTGSPRRHGPGRRHTLANGIDQNMLKHMKQLEEESSILSSGLAMIESAREWYTKQLASVSDKQAMLGKVTYNDNSVEAHQERMNFQRARIAEINQHLRTLLESSEKGFPLHMNLAMTAKPGGLTTGIDAPFRGLREQNQHLMEEINQKKEQINQLEKEKSSLVRELFEARSKNKSNYDDTTFM